MTTHTATELLGITADIPAEGQIHRLLEEQVQRAPDAIAVSYEGESLTYAELNRRANQLARYLNAIGVAADKLVGLCVERSLEMVVGMIGILKAGGAYVPLDPAYPSERIEYMLKDAAPTVLLTQSHVKDRFTSGAVRVICLDCDWSAIGRYDSANLPLDELAESPADLAYVIYTSGSTGRPKGVAVEHRNVINHWHALESLYRAGYDCRRIAVNAPFTFDASVQQFVQMLSGCTLFLIPQSLRLDAHPLLEFVRENAIEGIDCTPTQLKTWLSAGLLEGVGLALRTVLVGGEAIDPTLWDTLARSHLAVYNVYGPTECTVDSTAARLTVGTGPHIGRPLLNTRAYILDEQAHPVAGGIPGELYIAGAGLARGYLNRPELTQERFLPDPFFPAPGARMYKTGDLAQWRADGNLDFLGRNDDQVKIRGHRIELGEIEGQLRQHARVKEAVVIAREDEPGEKRLVGYVVVAGDSPDESAKRELILQLRDFLSERLPAVWMPTALVVLERLPLTSSGKIDRRALPAPESHLHSGRPYEAPRGELEEELATLWQSLLRIEQVGRNDNFFELGGHSLLIASMMEKLRHQGLQAHVQWVFDSPTLADLAKKLASAHPTKAFSVPANRIPADCKSLRPDMLPLVELSQAEIDQIVMHVPGGAGNVQDIYPLAPLQEGILFHHLKEAHSGDTYVLPTLFSLSSRESIEDLIRALELTIERHDAFRTAIAWEQLPQPVQVVYREAHIPVETLEIDPDREVMQQLWERMSPAYQSVDLGRAPLMRLLVTERARDGKWYAILQMHHLISDHEAQESLLAELAAVMKGEDDSLPATAPYRNHVAQALAQAKTGAAQEFFRGKLADIDESCAPFGLMNVHGNSRRIEEKSLPLDTTLGKRVRLKARELGVSPAALFHAAWALVVTETSGRPDAVFGSVLSGRMNEVDSGNRALGMLINTLPVRLRVQDISVRELVGKTHRELAELLEHEQASLAVAQRCSGVVGSAPLFTTLLNCLHSIPSPVFPPGSEILGFREWTNYPIAVSIDDRDDSFTVIAHTDRGVDPLRIIGYLAAATESLLNALDHAGDTLATALDIVPAAERRLLVEQFNATAAEYPQDRLVHEMFEAQVARAPTAIAAICAEQTLTYTELNQRANRLARYLLLRGVRAGDCVPVIMARSLEMLIAQLAVIKAGAAYLPIDPATPVDRQVFMVKDCQPRCGLSLQEPPAELRELEVQWVCAFEPGSPLQSLSAENLAREAGVTSDAPIYVMYTSGSTGTPKGVLIPHRGVTRLIVNAKYIDIGPTDCFTHSSNPAFDAATFEIWGTLLNGARLVVVPQPVLLDSAAFAALIEEHQVTVLWITIGLFTQYADVLVNVLPRLRYVITGGDVVDPELIRRVLRSGPPQNLFNAYGPTECTTFTTTYPIRTLDDVPHSIPIGRPITNTSVYILNRQLRPVPIGVAGEMFVGGPGVALGYLNRAELTSERFVQDPFSADPTARLYRTGDLARWRADGNIEFLGRNDRQVKLRGFRVELDEIEARALQITGIREAAVIVREDVPGQKRLVAYITTEPGAALGVSDIRDHLAGVLPDFMVPAAIVSLPRMPLTANGKLDRRTLPAPEVDAYVVRSFEAPQGELEQTLAAIWQEVLQVHPIGRGDNFFELGGHSLLAIKSVLQANRLCGASLGVSDIYRAPTVRDLALLIAGHGAGDYVIDLTAEAVLDAAIVPAPARTAAAAHAVFVTGATGFVGRFLLAELLQETSATVYCLVRSQSERQGFARLKESLSRWDLWRGQYGRRIVAVPGDLRAPHLGIAKPTYERLANVIDVVYHCGTSMNHLETYEMAKAANVEGARELIKFATLGVPKLLNVISTLAVFAPPQHGSRVVSEATPIDREVHWNSVGYTTSKWVAEQVFLTARNRGLSCNIFRLGLVWADSEQGRYDELQREYRLLKSCLMAGVGIERFRFDMAPTAVDYVARSIVLLAERYATGGGVFHLSADSQLEEGFFEACNRIVGTDLNILPLREWIAELRRLEKQGQSLPIMPLLEYYDHVGALVGMHFDSAATRRQLEASGIVAPVLDADLVRVCVESMLARDGDLQESALLFSAAPSHRSRTRRIAKAQ